MYRWFVDPSLSPEAVEEVRAYAKLHHDTTGKEDHAITAQVQRGLHSRGYDTGPLVVTPEIGNESENAVAHWQSLYLDELAGGRSP